MTTRVDIVNRALQALGTRTDVDEAELIAQSSNEAKQAMLVMDQIRDDLLRMAPWNCALKTAHLTYITSQPGTPENPNTGQIGWHRGQPSPPWLYEYQYPTECLRACWIIPAQGTEYVGSTPIYPNNVVTGYAPLVWAGKPIRFKVQTDEFVPATAAAVVNGGTGYTVGEIITLAATPEGEQPIGAPAKLRVLTAPGGVIATVEVISQVVDSDPPFGGSYFLAQDNPISQWYSDGAGTGATFNLTFGERGLQRVVLTNQECAIMVYCQRVTDINVMDTLFQSAWIAILAASLCMSLNGDKALANGLIQQANKAIVEARTADGNEGLTVNDTTPDWLRIRGLGGNYTAYGSFNNNNNEYDWGGLWPVF